jgi:hypothetical protein
MIALMEQAGFRNVGCFGPDDMARIYPSSDALRMPGYLRLIKGCVG